MKKYQKLHDLLRIINGFPPRLKKLYKDKASKKDTDQLEQEYDAALVQLEDILNNISLPRPTPEKWEGQIAN